MFTIAFNISGVLGVWQAVVVGGAVRLQLRAMRWLELILAGGAYFRLP